MISVEAIGRSRGIYTASTMHGGTNKDAHGNLLTYAALIVNISETSVQWENLINRKHKSYKLVKLFEKLWTYFIMKQVSI